MPPLYLHLLQRERARIGGSKGIVAYDWAPDGRSITSPLGVIT